jgi:DNA replication protein DnaC
MEEEEIILEAQRRLEEKKASMTPTDLTQIGLAMEEILAPAVPEVLEVPQREINPRCRVCRLPVDYGTLCSICREKEELRYRQRLEAEAEANDERRREKKIREYMQQSCIGERFVGMGFVDYHPENEAAQKVYHACIEFTKDFHPTSGTNLLMIGSPGTGKNMLAAIICQALIKQQYSCLHTTAMRCVRRVKDSWRDKGEKEQEIINSFIGPDLLVIDEVGVQFESPTELLYLTEIINDRYEKKRPTILISNLTLKQLEEIMGARIMDRFYEGDSKFLVFNWPSYRRKR